METTMTRYIIHFVGTMSTESIHAPNIETAEERAEDKYFNRIISHIEEA